MPAHRGPPPRSRGRVSRQEERAELRPPARAWRRAEDGDDPGRWAGAVVVAAGAAPLGDQGRARSAVSGEVVAAGHHGSLSPQPRKLCRVPPL